jgi:hypothetical protein
LSSNRPKPTRTDCLYSVTNIENIIMIHQRTLEFATALEGTSWIVSTTASIVLMTGDLPWANADHPIRINFNPISAPDPALAQWVFYLDLSRVRCPSHVMLFETDKFPEHGPTSISIAWLRKWIMNSRGHMGFDSRKAFLIQWLDVPFSICIGNSGAPFRFINSLFYVRSKERSQV